MKKTFLVVFLAFSTIFAQNADSKDVKKDKKEDVKKEDPSIYAIPPELKLEFLQLSNKLLQIAQQYNNVQAALPQLQAQFKELEPRVNEKQAAIKKFCADKKFGEPNLETLTCTAPKK